MHSVEQMYQLINDVNSYPQFVPDCSASEIVSQNDGAMTAKLLVSKGGLKKWFTTKNTLIENQAVMMELVDGPFKKLTGGWKLQALSEEACKVSLELEYEFSSKMFDFAFGRVFDNMANNMVQAFTLRAKEVHG